MPPLPLPSQFLAAGAALVLAACAGATPIVLRLQVVTAADWTDPAALRGAVEQVAGVPVRDAAGVAPRRHAITLECADAAACAAARERLQASPLFVEVADDTRQRTPVPPAPSSTR